MEGTGDGTVVVVGAGILGCSIAVTCSITAYGRS
jgi:L-2-hydroxyglutarate oxidase LhgO